MRSKVTSKVHPILLTFVGSHDPFRGDDQKSGDGPVLSLLCSQRFSAVHLFYNNDAFLRRASDVLRAMRERGNEPHVTYEHVPVSDPTDHAALYQYMEDKALRVAGEAEANAELWVAVSSGTPQMQTCWMLLVLGGVLKARLIQVVPPHKLQSGQPVWREIEVTQQRFPKIVPPGPLERRLALAEQELASLRAERQARELAAVSGLIGEAPAFLRAVRLAKRFAAYDMPVLLLGETGTGKEEFSRLIHFSSPRAGQPFIPVNCASLPAEIVESELFGHVKGAFTGAIRDKPGLFHVAREGTIFLDEIGELPLPAQAKLLRVLETRAFRPVGATAEKSTNARIIAATHRDLDTMIADGSFREDLLYRLNTAEVRLPSLTARREDIAVLAEHFLRKFCERHQRLLRFEPAVLAALEEADWPGNVRALKHTVERLAVLASGDTIRTDDLVLPTARVRRLRTSPAVSVPEEPINLPEVLNTWERGMMEDAIARFQGNRSAAARHLGYEEPTFRKKCREYFGRKM